MGIVDNGFVKWVAKQMADVTQEGTVERLELWHIIEGEHAEKLDTFEVDSDLEPLELADAVWQVAEHDVNNRLGGEPNRYTVQAFKQGLDPFRSTSFILRGGTGRWAMLGNSTEPPTEKGMLAQHMRQGEQLHHLLVQLSTAQTGPVMRENQELRQQLKDAYDNNLQLAIKAQELLDTSHQRQLEQAREESRERRHDQMMGMLMATMPALLTQLLGAKGMPGALMDNMTSRSLMELFRNMDEQEVVGVIKSLKPHNQVAVMQLYQASKEQYMKEQEQKPALFRDKNLPEEEDKEEEPVKH